jgi:hypothetical protein
VRRVHPATPNPERGPPAPIDNRLSLFDLTLDPPWVIPAPAMASVSRQIVAHSDGVPLFIEELTKTVIESGLFQLNDGIRLLAQFTLLPALLLILRML